VVFASTALAKARELPRWREPEVFTPLERDAMECAEAMSQTPPTVSDELSTRLPAQLGHRRWSSSPRGVALASQYARTNAALGIEAQGFSAACGPAPLAQPNGV
jgi:alkylhydroperoxidase family enzyme